MGESEARQAEERIGTVEKRLAALHDLGVDTASLRSQIAFARTCLQEGRIGEVESLCDEVLVAARRLAEGGQSSTQGGDARQRTGRFTRDQLAAEVKALLSQGLLAKLLAEQRAGPDPRLEARLQALESGLERQSTETLAFLAQTRAAIQADQAALRAEALRPREAATPGNDPAPSAPAGAPVSGAPPFAEVLASFASQASAQQERFLAALGDGLRELGERASPSLPSGDAASAQQAVAGVLEAFAAQASAQQERFLAALGDGLSRIGERASPSPPSGDASAQQAVAGVLEAFAAQASAQQERFLAALSDGLRQLGERAAAPPASETSGQPAVAQAIDVFHQGLERLADLLVQRLPSAPPADAAPAGRVGDWLEVAGEEPAAGASPSQGTAVSTHGTTRMREALSTRTDKPAVAAPAPLDTGIVRRLVADEVGQQFSDREAAGQGGGEPLMVFDPDQVRSLVAAEVESRLAQRPAEPAAAAAPRDADLRKALLRLLPDVLNEDAVRRQIFTLIALEATGSPGVLGELTGLRSFLRRELALAAEELAKDSQPV